MQALDLQQLKLIFFLLLGIIALILGGLIAYLVTASRRQRERRAQTYEQENLEPRPALEDTGQILRLVRENPGAHLQVEIGGRRYNRLDEIVENQARRQVVEAALELIRFTGVLAGADAALAPPDDTYNWREDVRHGAKNELERIRATPPAPQSEREPLPQARPASGEEMEERFLGMLADGGPAGPPEKPNLVGALQRRWAPKAPDRGQPSTFVDQIDKIVQRRIQFVPALARRDLHVRPGEDGGVRFVFEGQEYENLEDLPNLTARQVIKDSIQEWDETT